MAERIEILKQRVLRTHLADLQENGLAEKPPLERGYLDENNEATQRGTEFLTLHKAGLIDKAGNLTEEGQIYATNYRDSLDAPLDVYKRREERGLNKIDKEESGDGGGFWSMLGDFVTEGIPRYAETVYNTAAAPIYEAATIIPRKIGEAITGEEIKLPRTMTTDEKINRIAENVTGGVLASEGLAAGVVFGSEKVLAEMQGKRDEALAAKQEWERHQAEITELKGAEMMEFLTGMDTWGESRERLVEKQGDEAVTKDEQADRLAGNFILDPNNLFGLAAGKAVTAGAGAFSRATLHAEKLALKARALRMGQVGLQAERATLEAGIARAKEVASTTAERAAAFRSVGNEAQALRYEATSARVNEKISGITGKIDEILAKESELAMDLERMGNKPGVAERFLAANQRLAAIRQVPANAIGGTLEAIGSGLIKTDAFVAEALDRVGLTGVYKSLHSLPGRIGAIATAPLTGAIPAAVPQILASGPLMQSVGNFAKILGKELIAERGSVPFWRRVANNSTISKTQRFLAHRMDEATLGGLVPEVTSPAIKGTVAAYPMNLAFDVLQDPEGDVGAAAVRAIGPSLVFGGGSAGAGAIFKGSQQRLKQIRIADEINFTRALDQRNIDGFRTLPRGPRRALSTYAAAFPNLNWDFNARESHYDPTTNTIAINPRSNNPLRPLIAHEVAHYVTIRNQMQPVVHSLLLGDGITPGFVRDITPPRTETTDPTIPRTRMRRFDTPERKRAMEILNSGNYPGLTALFLSADKIAPRNPAVALIKRRKKNGARLTNREIRILEEDAGYDNVAQAIAHSTGKYGKIAREALSLIIADHGKGVAPDIMAGRISPDMKPSEMWLQISKELKQIERLKDVENDRRNDNREWSQRDIKSHLAEQTKAEKAAKPQAAKQQEQAARFAEANAMEGNRMAVAPEEMSQGDTFTVAGENVRVAEVVKSRDSLGNEEVEYVILDGGEKFGQQKLESGEILHADMKSTALDDDTPFFPENRPATPGILRAVDGTLDPQFQKFKDAYEARMEAAGLGKPSLEKVAEEYFNEAVVDTMVEMVESGEISRMAGRTQAGRHLRAFIEATIPRTPIIRDLFFRTGGALDANGRPVMGNGLLTEGLRDIPEARALMRKMIRETAGQAATSMASKTAASKDGAGARMTIQEGDPIIDSFHAILETDANGNVVIDKDGNRKVISRATDEARSSAGLILTEAQAKRVEGGYLPNEGELKAMEGGKWFGEYIEKPVLDELARRGILNAKQIAILRNINTATKSGQGHRFLVINHPATVKGRGGKVRYATLGATLRETVPLGIGITKDGNILIHLINVEQLNRNIQNRAASKRGRDLYSGNTEAIKQDIDSMIDLHKTNTKTDKFYQDKYGAKWQEHQNFINTIFGVMTKEQRSINPMLDADKIKDSEGVYRTYRLDRISKATKMDGTPLPVKYPLIKANFLPDGVPDQPIKPAQQP